jgi:hypothetical protein
MDSTILFDEPFSRNTLDRLRLLFLHYETVEVIDHSADFNEYERADWNMFWDAGSVRRETEKLCREMGVTDRNLISKMRVMAQAKATESQRAIAPFLKRAYAPHKQYWELLRELDKKGHVKVIPAPLDQKFTPNMENRDARAMASDISSEYVAWTRDYMARTAAQYQGATGDGAMQAVVGLMFMVLAHHLLTGIARQVQGRSFYSGEDGLIRAASKFSNLPKPVAARLGESVLSVEVPQICVTEFDELAEVKRNLSDLRVAFQAEMQFLTSDLGKREWNDDLVRELLSRKTMKVDPVVFDLRRKLGEPKLRRMARTALEGKDTAIGAAGIGLALAAGAGATLNIQILAGILGTGIGAVAGALSAANKDEITIDQNRLAYVVRLDKAISN